MFSNWVHVKEGEERDRDVKCVTERRHSKTHKPKDPAMELNLLRAPSVKCILLSDSIIGEQYTESKRN